MDSFRLQAFRAVREKPYILKISFSKAYCGISPAYRPTRQRSVNEFLVIHHDLVVRDGRIFGMISKMVSVVAR